MNTLDERKTLREVGERFIVKEIIGSLQASDHLLDGFGHDAGFMELALESNEVLVVNTDRSGINIAFQLGLAGAECVGDLGVSHAISDVVAAGGRPRAVSIALLLPPETEVGFVRKVMQGAELAAARYGAIIVGGDTKQNPKFSMVVTAIGTAHSSKRLRRSSAKSGDVLVVTGNLGSMLLATLAFRRGLALTDKVRGRLTQSLVEQRPPFEFGRALAEAGLANACTDISDGLSGALFGLCDASNVGVVIEERNLPIDPDLSELASHLGLRPMQLTLAGGDWQYLYALPASQLDEAAEIAQTIGVRLTVVGTVIESRLLVGRTRDGDYRHLLRIEHDSFADGGNGNGYFEKLGTPQECFGEPLDAQQIEDVMCP